MMIMYYYKSLLLPRLKTIWDMDMGKEIHCSVSTYQGGGAAETQSNKIYSNAKTLKMPKTISADFGTVSPNSRKAMGVPDNIPS